MHSRNDMHTHVQVALQFGAEIAATAKSGKNNRDTTGTAKSNILCQTTLWVVGLGETGNEDGAGKYRLTEIN
jgi:hypothetical protein